MNLLSKSENKNCTQCQFVDAINQIFYSRNLKKNRFVCGESPLETQIFLHWRPRSCIGPPILQSSHQGLAVPWIKGIVLSHICSTHFFYKRHLILNKFNKCQWSGLVCHVLQIENAKRQSYKLEFQLSIVVLWSSESKASEYI